MSDSESICSFVTNTDSIRYDSNTGAESDSSSDSSLSVNTKISKKTEKDDQSQNMVSDNCEHEHYNCKCKFIAPCCQEVFSCWKCHDAYFEDAVEESKHVMVRKDIKKIICKECGKQQDVSNQCIVCKTKFASHFCTICNIHCNFDNVSHCAKCNACIVGPNGMKLKHCDKCACCISEDIYYDHKCIPNKLNDSCVICLENLNNKESLITMICGHTLHFQCYTSLTTKCHKCPSCSKTIKDMSTEYLIMDLRIKNEPIKNNKYVEITCIDCEKKSNTMYHYVGLKCKSCGSYNTREKKN